MSASSLRIVIRRDPSGRVYPVDRTRVYAGDVEVGGITGVTMEITAGGGAATFTITAYCLIEEQLDDGEADEDYDE